MPIEPLALIRLLEAQWRSPARVAAAQWRRFKRLLRHAYDRSPFHRERFATAGITPADIRDRRDLAAVPVTRRADLLKPERLLVRGVSPRRLRRSMTSGSTGRRTVTYFDRDAWRRGKYLLKLRARLACGLRPWHRIAHLTEAREDRGRAARSFFRQRRFSVLDPIECHRASLERYDPAALYGFPSGLSLLADGDVRIRPSRLFTSSELLDPRTRAKLERAFGAEVFDVYGCTELKEIAWECPAHAGYHINSDWILVEVVDAEGKPTDGVGRILVTSLGNYAMPLIRYEVGDTGRRLAMPCPCGRGLPLMLPAEGRTADYFSLPDGSRVSPYALTCAIEPIDGLRQYQIRQRTPGCTTVTVVPGEAFGRHTTQRIRAALEPVLPGVRVEIATAPVIAREPSGKYRIVASEVPPSSPYHETRIS
jgi:phenylacetate-CoA ligase